MDEEIKKLQDVINHAEKKIKKWEDKLLMKKDKK